jgi:hypothetical protein
MGLIGKDNMALAVRDAEMLIVIAKRSIRRSSEAGLPGLRFGSNTFGA